jgi:hypothetical protein
VVFPSSYGQEYLFCLQLLLLGPFEYVTAPIVVYSTRRTIPHDNPMYTDVPVTIFDLLTGGGMRRWKCWAILFLALYFLMRIPEVNVRQRVQAAITHTTTFTRVYRRKLAREILFQLLLPVSWLVCTTWRLAAQWKLPSALARKLKTVFLSV